ncbi:MAG: RsmB/NOP family class I SAM-dependent RNA methyltransferase [bacterium]|nr:RsmB/NOP family class I SAM-dependent RNA methyltransferase [bacterium]
MSELGRAGYAGERKTQIPEEITLASGMPLASVKAFQHGHFVVQDPASMLPPHLLEPQPGDTVLDVCAAPGGKTTHLAQLARDEALVIATDLHSHRLGRVEENAERLGIDGMHSLCADGVAPPFRDGSFDRVLVDAPCTGLGTLRRHPDLKWRVSPGDAARLGKLQLDLLRSAVQQCKNAGVIVYSVCTVTPQETGDVIDRLLDSTEGLQPEDGPDWLNQWKIETGRYRTLPGADGLDGFFLTRLRKGS